MDLLTGIALRNLWISSGWGDLHHGRPAMRLSSSSSILALWTRGTSNHSPLYLTISCGDYTQSRHWFKIVNIDTWFDNPESTEKPTYLSGNLMVFRENCRIRSITCSRCSHCQGAGKPWWIHEWRENPRVSWKLWAVVWIALLMSFQAIEVGAQWRRCSTSKKDVGWDWGFTAATYSFNNWNGWSFSTMNIWDGALEVFFAMFCALTEILNR
jgi:hypothetical protein